MLNPSAETVNFNSYSMAEFAQSQLGIEFFDHYSMLGCGMNRTKSLCMASGLGGPEGYDCSGLIVKAASFASAIPVEAFERRRHITQMAGVSKPIAEGVLRPGDIVLSFFVGERGMLLPQHGGIAITSEEMIHATSITNTVSVAPIPKQTQRRRVGLISARELIENL